MAKQDEKKVAEEKPGLHTGDMVIHRLSGHKMMVMAVATDNKYGILCKFQSNDGHYTTATFESWEFEGFEPIPSSYLFSLQKQAAPAPNNGVAMPQTEIR